MVPLISSKGPGVLLLDIILRGSSIGLLLLLAGLLWRAPIGWEGRISVAVVALAQSAFLLTTAALPLGLPPLVAGALLLLASLVPNAITWLIVTIFLDPPGRRWPWLVASTVASAHFYLYHTAPAMVGHIPCGASSMLLYGALFSLAILSSRDDLVECRCRARPGFAAAIAGLGLILTVAQAFGWSDHSAPGFALTESIGTLAVTLSFAVWILRPDTTLWPGAPDAAPVVTGARPSNQDTALIARINAAMAAGIWREEGLTIGAMATHLKVPEHRLRRAINGGLGHRNFSSFINRARIAEAQARLSNPEALGTTVLEVAYDVGFASLGPFNRAFRAETGQSPTEFRNAALTRPFADSENHTPISVNLH